MDWKHLLASITGTVDQELLLRNEYLVTENRILRDQLKGRVQLPAFSANNLPAHARERARKSLPGAGLRAGAGVKNVR